MSYLVLARKYRPQRFDELVGQEHVARTLTNAIAQQRVHHAFLFTGARGVGKTSAARILAKALSCQQGPTATPCGECEFCREIVGGQSVDVFEIDGASNNGVDEVRALREGVRYAPAKGRKKIYIIDEVHMLSGPAFNALLKTLEEPPPHVVFVLATTEAHKIPITILSRCQRYDFKLVPTARIVEHLAKLVAAEGLSVHQDALSLLARQAAGSVRDALSLLDQVIAFVGQESITRELAAETLGVADRRLLVQMTEAVLGREAGAALRILAAAADRGIDLGQLARGLLAFLRDVEVVNLARDPADLVDASVEELSELQSLGIKAPEGLLRVLFDRWARAVDEGSRSQTARLLYEMAVVDLCRAEPLTSIDDLFERLEAMEARLAGSVPTARTPGPPARAASLASPASPAPSRPPAPRAERASSPAEAWHRVLATFQQGRDRVGALLAHAEVASADAGCVTLAFPDKLGFTEGQKAHARIEQALASELGAPVRLVLVQGNSAGPPETRIARSEVAVENDALAADRARRDTEARAHPMIKKAQDLFGATVREIKTE